MIRYLFYTWALIILCSAASNANTNPVHCKNKDASVSAIEIYLSSIGYDNETEVAEIFVDFLVMENDDLYTVDFMVDEKGEIIVLSKEFEEEYYKVNTYSTKLMKKYSSAVAQII